MPAKRTTMPARFWTAMFAAADVQSAARIRRPVSGTKAEKVVKAR